VSGWESRRTHDFIDFGSPQWLGQEGLMRFLENSPRSAASLVEAIRAPVASVHAIAVLVITAALHQVAADLAG
jgi:hypothetical protein